MRLGKQLAKLLLWVFVLGLSLVAGGFWFVYTYLTDKSTATRLIRDYSARWLPGSELEPGRVHTSLLGGEVVLRDAMLQQQIDGAPFLALRVPRLSVQFNPRRLVRGRVEMRKVIVSYPTLWLCRRRDGSLNLQGLLADPWPGPWLESSPPILIENGTVALVPEEETTSVSGSSPSSSSAQRSIERASTRSEGGAGWKADKRSPRPLSRLLVAPPQGKNDRALVLLRELSLQIEAAGGFLFKFEGSARSDMFDKLTIKGTIDLDTGLLTLEGELAGLTISETLRRRIPREAQGFVEALALNGGVVDLELNSFSYDPKAALGKRCRYTATARLREGVWECPHLPFPINHLSALLSFQDGVLSIRHALGSNGLTGVRFWGTCGLDDPKHEPLDLHVEVTDLELEDRLRKRTPAEYVELWDLFKPSGRVNASVGMSRKRAGEAIDLSATVRCVDVAAEYRHFPYRLDHMTGWLTLKGNSLTVDLQTLLGNRPLTLTGRIADPGDDAVVRLDIRAESVPIDDTLKRALPPRVRKVVDQFQPSGLAKAHATVFRQPMVGPDPRPEGLIAIDAQIDLTERCEMKWAHLPYPVRGLRGRLDIHPDNWVFKDMRGSNGQAIITASGSVQKLPLAKLPSGADPLKIDVFLQAQNLPFSDELRAALPVAWRRSWPTINPSGTCNVDAAVHVLPGREDSTHIVIVPRAESNLRLQVTRTPQPGFDPGGTLELRMENVGGRFVFDNGKVAMNNVEFQFRGAPVRFSRGTVVVEDSGRFDLRVTDLWIKEIRFDGELRGKMPPAMQQFALRLDDGRTYRARGQLQIGWSGEPGDPAWCKWDKTLVVFNDNTIKTGVPLEHLQGQLDHVSGWSDGRSIDVHGILRLESVSFLGQQITQLESPFHINRGVARLDNLRGSFLGGQLLGDGAITLDTTPRYRAAMELRGVQLQEYARSIPGRQSYRGNIDAQIAINGLGNEIRNLQGHGEAHVRRGNLGELPLLLRLAQRLSQTLRVNLPAINGAPSPGRSAFDSADVEFTIAQGLTTFQPIRFTGNAFSLLGQGTLDPQGNVDLRLNLLWGRDRLHIPLVSDLTRIASSPFLMVHVKGTAQNPQFELEPLPQVIDALRASNRSRLERRSE